MYEAIVWNGKNSYLDFGLTIAEPPKITNPKLNEVRESVPYMNGDYDFTYQSGKPTYSRRQVKVVFNITGDCFDDMWRKRCEAVEWLMSAHGGALRFDQFMHGWQFEDVSPTVLEDYEILGKRASRLEVTFTAAPYLSNGKQNITIIPTCPRFTGNTFGYIYKSGCSIKVTTTDNICENVQQTTNSGSEKITSDITFTADTPDEIVFALYTSPKAWRSVFAIDASGNSIGDIPAECEDTNGNTIYRWSAEKYPAAGVRFVVDIQNYRGINILNAGEVMTAPPAPIRCKYNDNDIQFNHNGGNMTYETKLVEGGNIIAQPYSSAEVYAALRKEAL